MHVTLLWSEKWCELVVTTAFLLVTYVLNLPELFLDQKWCIQVTGPIGLLRIIPVSQFFFTPAQMLSSSNQWAATFLQIFFFKSISRGGGVFSQASFEISQIVLVKFLLRTSYQQRFLKCIFFKRQRFLTLETGQLLLVIEHWSHHDGNLKCYPAL